MMRKKLLFLVAALVLLFSTAALGFIAAAAESSEVEPKTTGVPDRVIEFTTKDGVNGQPYCRKIRGFDMDPAAASADELNDGHAIQFAEGDKIEFEAYSSVSGIWVDLKVLGYRAPDDWNGPATYQAGRELSTKGWTKYSIDIKKDDNLTKDLIGTWSQWFGIISWQKDTNATWSMYWKNIFVKDKDGNIKLVVWNNTTDTMLDGTIDTGAEANTEVKVVDDPLFDGTVRTDRKVLKITMDLAKRNDGSGWKVDQSVVSSGMYTGSVNSSLRISATEQDRPVLASGDYLEFELFGNYNNPNVALAEIEVDNGGWNANMYLSQANHSHAMSWGKFQPKKGEWWGTYPMDYSSLTKSYWSIPGKGSELQLLLEKNRQEGVDATKTLVGKPLQYIGLATNTMAVTNAPRFITFYYKTIQVKDAAGNVKYNLFDGSQESVTAVNRGWGAPGVEDVWVDYEIVELATAEQTSAAIAPLAEKLKNNTLKPDDWSDVEAVDNMILGLDAQEKASIQSDLDSFAQVKEKVSDLRRTTVREVVITKELENSTVEYGTTPDFASMKYKKIYYDNHEETDLAVQAENVQGFDPKQVGDQAVTLKIDDVETVFMVTVVDSVKSVTWKNEAAPELNVFYGQVPAWGSCVAVVEKSSGSYEVAIDESMVSGYQSGALGAQELTVNVAGKTLSLKVTVNDSVIRWFESSYPSQNESCYQKNDNSSHVFLGIVITKCECRSKKRAKKGHLGPVWD